MNTVPGYRCNGSDTYVAFIDDLLGIRPQSTLTDFDQEYLFRVYDDPCAMRDDLEKLNAVNNKTRMLAGYCWNWNSRHYADKNDIILENGFEAQWNFSNTETWAIDPESFAQVGCIHTSQGVEFDYVGVIIGKDLVWKDGSVQTVAKARAKDDKSLNGAKSKGGPQLEDRLIRNTYKVLLTRGQKGCFVYCVDKQLRDYFKEKTSLCSKSTMT